MNMAGVPTKINKTAAALTVATHSQYRLQFGSLPLRADTYTGCYHKKRMHSPIPDGNTTICVPVDFP